MEPNKGIDAVAMTRRIRQEHSEQLRDATSAERIRFYREKASRLEAVLTAELNKTNASCSDSAAR